MAVRVIGLIFSGDVERNLSKVAVFDGLLRLVGARAGWLMSALMEGRVTLSRSAVCAVRELMLVSEAPIVLRSAASPEMNRWSWSMSCFSAASWCVHGAEHRVEVGDGAADDLVAVREGRGQGCRLGQQRVDVAALALQDADDVARELVDVLGRSAANNGLKPLNRTVRSRADWVWSSPIVAPSLSGVAPPTSWVSAM